MSIPPLVCSTPPPPDQVEEEGFNDEFTFNYADLSPTHQYEPMDYLYETPSPRDKLEDSLYVTPSDLSISIHEPNEDDTTAIETSDKQANHTKDNSNTLDNDNLGMSEDFNVEDLNLKIESLHLDLECERESVEDSLNSTFDDFGTFLSNTDFIPKAELSESDKESKSHGTYSEESTSLHNEDWDNISQNSLNTNLNTDKDEDGNIKKDKNDNIPKEGALIMSTELGIDDSPNVEESVDSGFKLSVNNSNDQSDSKSYDDISVSEGHTPSKTDANGSNYQEPAISISQIEGSHKSNPIKEAEDDFDSFAEAKIDFKANFSDACEDEIDEYDDFASFEKAEEIVDNSYTDAKNKVDVKFSSHMNSNELKEDENTTSSINNSLEATDHHATKVEPFLDDSFEDFTDFHSKSSSKVQQIDDVAITVQSQGISENGCIDEITSAKSENNKTDDDDDFGDFDTYNPTVTSKNDQPQQSSENGCLKSHQINDLIFSSDSDIVDILKTAVTSIYQEDITSEQTENNHELLASLGGSWNHLKDYEVKQAYLFPWNNSSSQKTLLKSLGIDSRNILFGPKWNSNMPRFAANLGTSPLQPIKQTYQQSSDHQREEATSNNPVIEENVGYTEQKVGDWQAIDNFAIGDNQPSCHEREDELVNRPHSKVGDSSNKFEKHQPPSILNIGRKINLPDTHIFTPTDSETPWSHTIHYEDTLSNFVPGISCNMDENISHSTENSFPTQHTKGTDDFDDFKRHNIDQPNQSQNISPRSTEFNKYDLQTFPLHILEKDTSNVQFDASMSTNDFDDFGDFHSATSVEPVTHQTEIIQPISVLQPVKVTPSVNVPVVNWPAPGDVDTSAFEEFSNAPSIPMTSQTVIEKKEKPKQIPEIDVQSQKFDSKDLYIPPYNPHKAHSPGTSPFILKETKIDSVATEDSTNTFYNKNNTNTSDVDEFSDFQSVFPVKSAYQFTPYQSTSITNNQYSHSTILQTSNAPNNMSFNNDFDDFQAVPYNPMNSKPNQLTTTSFISTPQTANYFLPTTLGGSFLKPEVSQNYSSMPFQREEPSSKGVPQAQQILQPLSLENFSQINWPNPGMDLQDLSRFNPINSIQTYSGPKETKLNNHHSNEDDGWSDFVSTKPANQPAKYNPSAFNQSANAYTTNQQNEEDDWSDFVSGTVLPSRSANELKTISQNIHSQTGSCASTSFGRNTPQHNSTMNQYPNLTKQNLTALPHLSYASSKPSNKNHFQNL